MNLRQFCEIFIRPKVGHRWATLAIWEYGLLWAINDGLSIIYARKWSYRSRAVRTEWTLATPAAWCCEIAFKTQFPIARVTGIYSGPREIITTDKTFCPCECKEQDCHCACETSCCTEDMKSIPMKKVQPGGKLKSFWDYKIRWWNFGGGTFGNVVSVFVCKDHASYGCNFDKEWMYITYQARYNIVKCYTDNIPLPDALLPALWMYITSLVKTNSGNWKAQEDTYRYQLADTLMLNIDALENNTPDKLVITTKENDPRTNRHPNRLG